MTKAQQSTEGNAHRPQTGYLAVLVFLFLLTLGATNSPAAAQDPETAPEEPADAWAASVELGFTTASGNQELTVLTSAFDVGHTAENLYDAELQVQARYGSSQDEIVAESYKMALNIGLRPVGRWTPFVFSVAQRDRFQLLDLRLNSGAGARFRFSQNGSKANVGVALLHSYELLDTDSLPNALPTSRARFRVAAESNFELREGVTLTNTTHFEPIAQDLADYLLSVDTALKVLLTKGLALSVGYEFDRDSAPPAPSVESNDYLLRAGIILEW